MFDWLLAGAFIPLVIGFYWISIATARSQVRSWCANQGYEVARLQVRLLKQGPFRGSILSVRQIVYFAVLRDSGGSRHQGFLRAGHRWKGVGFGEVEASLAPVRNLG